MPRLARASAAQARTTWHNVTARRWLRWVQPMATPVPVATPNCTPNTADPAAGEGQYYNIRSGFWASEGSTGAADTPLSPPHRLDQPGRPR